MISSHNPSIAPKDVIGETQRNLNLHTEHGWEAFRDHRKRVTELILAQGRGDRLCILGAGNCNDIDLPVLLQSFRTIHLVDIDGAALRRGVARQRVAAVESIELHELDLTGIMDVMKDWTPASRITESTVNDCRNQPTQHVRAALPYSFDVVVSTCVLSQLIVPIVDTLGEQNPHFLSVIQAVRLGHLRLLVQLTAPGGVGILVSDVVSSDTYPQLQHTSIDTLPSVLANLIRQRNFFHGVNPTVLVSLFQSDPLLTSCVESVAGKAPWLWNLVGRYYAVCAIVLRTKIAQ